MGYNALEDGAGRGDPRSGAGKSVGNQETNIDRLLKARAALDEELRRHKVPLTILFTDLVGSTAYFDRYGDTAGLAMLRRDAELTTNTFSEFQGRVIKTIGDAVMAEFPEPGLAVRASAELQRRLLLLNQKLPERERMQLRVGINHGPAFRHGNDVFGDAVNLAARITKRCGPAQILISRSVFDTISHDPDLSCLWMGQVTIEGKADKEDIYEVLWTEAATYSKLRATVMGALARGEMASPGLVLQDLVPLAGPPTPPPEVAATPERVPVSDNQSREIGRASCRERV